MYDCMILRYVNVSQLIWQFPWQEQQYISRTRSRISFCTNINYSRGTEVPSCLLYWLQSS